MECHQPHYSYFYFILGRIKPSEIPARMCIVGTRRIKIQLQPTDFLLNQSFLSPIAFYRGAPHLLSCPARIPGRGMLLLALLSGSQQQSLLLTLMRPGISACPLRREIKECGFPQGTPGRAADPALVQKH